MIRRIAIPTIALLLAIGCTCDTGAQEETPAVNVAASAEKSVTEKKDTSCPAVKKQGTLIAGKFRIENPLHPRKPEKGEWYVDPVFGTCIVRLTNHAVEPPAGFARNDYSRRQPFNADDSRILVYAQDGYWHLYDANTLQYLRALDLGGGSVEPHWHPDNPDLLFVLPNNGGMTLDLYNVVTGERERVADFRKPISIAGHADAERITDIWPAAARLWTRSEGSPSMNARYWAFQVETEDFKPLGLVTYDAAANRIIGVYDFAADGGGIGRPNHVSMSPLGGYVVASWNSEDDNCPGPLRLGTLHEPCGLMAFSPDYTDAEGLAVRGPHSDLALDADGREVIVISNYDSGHVEMIPLNGDDKVRLWDMYIHGAATALHVSGKAYEKPGWVLISTYALRDPRKAHPWYTNRLMAVELARNPRILNIATIVSRTESYFSEPHAAVNRDFTRIVFNANWETGKDEDIDVYLVALPATALQRKQKIAERNSADQSSTE